MRKNRKRNIIWFNLPFNKSVKTNIGATFLKLLDKHFPPGSKLHKIFNKNCVKISYSFMGNMSSIIKAHNNKIITGTKKVPKGCNCRKKEECPLRGKCLSTEIVYKGNSQSNQVK